MKISFKLGMVVHVFNLRQMQADLYEIKASIAYIVSSKPVGDIGKPCLKNWEREIEKDYLNVLTGNVTKLSLILFTI